MPLLLPLLALAQAPLPARPYAACTLEIHGSLNTRRPGAKGMETVSETFQYVLPGWIQELEEPGGGVCFEFRPSRDPSRTPTGILNQHKELGAKSQHAWTQFYGSDFRSVGAFRFEANLRGQNLYPSGELTLGGDLALHEGSSTKSEPTTVATTPFPVIRRSPSDHGAPTLRFTTSSLWRLHRATAPFATQGVMIYQNRVGAVSYAGRVDLTFRLDPRERAEHP